MHFLLKKLINLKHFSGVLLGFNMTIVSFLFVFSKKSASPRTEILHNIDPLYKPAGVPLPNVSFNTTRRAALRKGDWKIITGNPSKYEKDKLFI